MRKIEKRAVVCLALAILLAAGMLVFVIKYFAEGGKWASSAFNRHLYDSNGVLISGTVLDRDGDVLSSVENGHRTYYDGAEVRQGDPPCGGGSVRQDRHRRSERLCRPS